MNRLDLGDEPLTETPVLSAVLVAVSALPGTMCWRHNSGALPDRNGRWVSFGLVGSGDVIGSHAVTITPEMVGRTVGVAFSIETKRPHGGRFSKKQDDFAVAWRKAGGLYIPARSAQEALDGLNS